MLADFYQRLDYVVEGTVIIVEYDQVFQIILILVFQYIDKFLFLVL
jgi:hypothetical protein